jgi:hypothetical protein
VRARDEFFACAGFTLNENCGVALGHHPDQSEDGAHGLAPAYDILQVWVDLQLAA